MSHCGCVSTEKYCGLTLRCSRRQLENVKRLSEETRRHGRVDRRMCSCFGLGAKGPCDKPVLFPMILIGRIRQFALRHRTFSGKWRITGACVGVHEDASCGGSRSMNRSPQATQSKSEPRKFICVGDPDTLPAEVERANVIVVDTSVAVVDELSEPLGRRRLDRSGASCHSSASYGAFLRAGSCFATCPRASPCSTRTFKCCGQTVD